MLLGLAIAGSVTAWAAEVVPLPPGKPAMPPLPPEKPPELSPTTGQGGQVPAGQVNTGQGPAPATPEKQPTGPAQQAPAPSGSGRATTVPPELPNISLDDEVACEERLHHLGVEFTSQRPIADGLCVVPAPLEVHRLSTAIGLAGPVTLNCATAESLARWAAEVAAPALHEAYGANLTDVTASGYACRTRNGAAGAPISEHATANAVDVSALGASGRAFVIGSFATDDRQGHALEDAVRRGACSYFETVLGPGADPEHANHLHLDHRARQTGYRICQ